MPVPWARRLRAVCSAPGYVPTALRQRAALHLTGSGRRPGWAPAPWTVNLVPELRCDLRCSYCSNGDTVAACRRGLLPPEWLDPLPPEAWRIILRRLARWRPWLNIGGGEPLLYDGLGALLQTARRLGFRASLTTNGSRLAEMAETLAQAGLSLVGVSLDGPPAVHDRVAGRAGSFAAAAEGIERLRAARGRPPIKAVLTVCPENHAQIAAGVAEILRLHPDRISLRHYMFTPRAALPPAGADVLGAPAPVGFPFGGRAAAAGWPAIDARRLWAEIAAARELAAAAGTALAIEPDFDEARTMAYYDSASPWPTASRGCSVPWHALEVHPNGDAVFCGVFLYRRLGNLLRSAPEAVWNGPRAHELRAALGRTGPLPFCSRCCGLLV